MMKFALLPAAAILLAATQSASAIVTLGASTQNFGLTGIGGDSQGRGQSTMSWGACSFDGTTTTCNLSGTYTGLGPGGTYNFALSYPGNGAFPLNAVSQTAGGDQFFAQYVTGSYSLDITLTPTNQTPIHFYSFANFNFQYISPQCTGVPAGSCRVGAVGLAPGATITGPVNGTFDPTPHITTPGGAVMPNDYGNSSSIAPGSWMAMYGVNLATTQKAQWDNSFNGNMAPSSLSGTSVTVAGVPAYVSYVSPGQANVQVPTGIPTGTQQVLVTTAGGTSTPYSINVAALEPGLLAPSVFLINGVQNIAAQFANSNTFVLPPDPGVNTARAKPGDILTIYGIGFGPVMPDVPAGQITPGINQLQASVKISIGGVDAQITYAGLTPTIVGLDQFNVTVPNIPPNDNTPITYTVNGTPGAQTNMVLAIGN